MADNTCILKDECKTVLETESPLISELPDAHI